MNRLLNQSLRYLGYAVLYGAVAACSNVSVKLDLDEPGDQRLTELYEREYAWRQGLAGRVQNEEGQWVAGDSLPRVDAETQAEKRAYWEAALAELDEIEDAGLSDDQQINAAVFREIVQANLTNVTYRTYEAPLNSDTFFWAGMHPRMRGFEDVEAYEDYIARLRDLPRFLGENMTNMRAGMARGYTVPSVGLAGREQSVEPYTVEGPDNPYWEPLDYLPPGISDADRDRLQGATLDAIEEAVAPAYAQLFSFMRSEYMPAARQTIAARDLPDGPAFYRAQMRVYTTLDLDPKTVHEKGLEEVARIQTEMRAIIEEVGFDGDIPAFIDYLRTDPQFYAKTPEELMGFASYVAKRMDGRLGETLGFLPRRRFTIMPVPDAIAPFYTSGRGGLNGCLINTYDLSSRPLYAIPALTLHECAPGHALQAAIAMEAPGDIPQFRRDNYFSGYGEGWGLYTEWLGAQMGIYRTPYEHFGRLTFEMWRACRLVIDTGLHEYGWTRKQAQDYLKANTALAVHDITTEVDRYISWPGQALAYKLGEILIREKRAEAEAALGSDFDQRYFHDVIMGLRSVPLPVLEAELDRWIEGGGKNPYADLDP